MTASSTSFQDRTSSKTEPKHDYTVTHPGGAPAALLWLHYSVSVSVDAKTLMQRFVTSATRLCWYVAQS